MKFISSKTHTVIGLIVGIALLFAPQLFGFGANQTASSITIGVGIFIIISELVTTSSFSPLKLIPMRIHLVLDYLTGVFLFFSPWLFSFSETVWVPHAIVGVLVVGYAACTNPQVEVEESTV